MSTILKIAQEIQLPDVTTALNVMWLQVAETLTPADAVTVEADLDPYMKQMYERMTTIVSSQVGYGSYKVWTVDPITNQETFYTEGNAGIVNGTNATDPLPNGVAGIVGFLIPGRPRTPLNFLAGWGEGTLVDNNLSASAIAACLLFALDWRAGPAAVGSPTFTWVSGLYSRVDHAFLAAGLTAFVNIIAGYQRRRKPGVGI